MPIAYIPRSFGSLFKKPISLRSSAVTRITGFAQPICNMATCYSSAFNTSVIASGPLRRIDTTICRPRCKPFCLHLCLLIWRFVMQCCKSLFLCLCFSLWSSIQITQIWLAILGFCCESFIYHFRRAWRPFVPGDMPIECSMSMRFALIEIAIILSMLHALGYALIERFTQMSGTVFGVGFFRVFQTKHIFDDSQVKIRLSHK